MRALTEIQFAVNDDYFDSYRRQFGLFCLFEIILGDECAYVQI